MLTQKSRSILATILGSYLLWLMFHSIDLYEPKLPSDTLTLNEMAGTWTDPSGPRGNHIIFIWTKMKDEPGDPIALISSVYKTSGEIKDLLGYKDIPITFGFHSNAPDVVIFVNSKDNQTIMALKATDHNHLSIRVLSKDPARQKVELLSKPLSEPTVTLVREKEPDYRPNYK